VHVKLIINWESDIKGILNHWSRLLTMLIIMGADAFLFFQSKNSAVSYTAHVGGFITGLLMHIILSYNFEITRAERYFILPFTYFITIGLFVFAITWYSINWPPQSIFGALSNEYEGVDPNQPCCFSLLRCIHKHSSIDDFRYDDMLTCHAKFGYEDRDWTYKMRYNGVSIDNCNEF
jgi:hypothetical protein